LLTWDFTFFSFVFLASIKVHHQLSVSKNKHKYLESLKDQRKTKKMRALLQLSKRLSRTLVFSSSYSSLTSSRTFATLTLLSPDCHGAAITTNGNVYARPWFAIQHRGVKVNAIHVKLQSFYI
jgi:hypothetical protein